VVFGPVGELMNFMSADDIAAAARVSDASARRELPRPRPEGVLERRRRSPAPTRADAEARAIFDRQTRL
jgi:transposase